MAQPAFDPYAYAESTSEAPVSTTAAPATAFDPYSYAAKASSSAAPDTYQGPEGSIFKGMIQGGYNLARQGIETPISGFAQLGALISGGDPDKAREAVMGFGNWQSEKPKQEATSEAMQTAAGKVLNAPLTAYQEGTSYLQKEAQKLPWYKSFAEYENKHPVLQKTEAALQGLGETGIQAAPVIAGGLESLRKTTQEGAQTEAPGEAGSTETKPKVDINTPPEEMTPAQQKSAATEREAILNRVGIQNARNSALEANKKDAATDFQLSKTDTPAGHSATAQFEHEKDALASHAENIVNKTGGTIGLDEDSLANRGATIAKPFDDLRQWYEQQTKDLYSEAQKRSGFLSNIENPQAVTNLNSVEQTINNPQYINTLLARDQGGLLGAIKSQLQEFRRQNPNGFTPAAAEQFRQWINQIWTNDNKRALGPIVDAVDKDVLSSAGEDIFGRARALYALKKNVLENPNGIADLFETDPKTPINRSTPYEKIPDKLSRLSIDQYKNVIDTLKNMPDELQDSSKAAIGEMQAHLANKIHQAGTQTRSGAARVLWNSDAVNKVISDNGAKLRLAFQDDPEALANIKDLQDAGNILKVEPSYPGAYAQEINLKSRGIIPKVLPMLGKAAGGAAGGTFGPATAVGGTMAGGAAGEALAESLSGKAALKAWKARTKKIGPP